MLGRTAESEESCVRCGRGNMGSSYMSRSFRATHINRNGLIDVIRVVWKQT